MREGKPNIKRSGKRAGGLSSRKVENPGLNTS